MGKPWRKPESRLEPLVDVEGMPPPHDLDVEGTVLTAFMTEGTGASIDDVIDFLRQEHFYSEAHQRIYEACLELHRVGQPCDATMVASWLRDRGRLEQVGGAPYLHDIIRSSPAIAKVRKHALIIRDKWTVRQTIAICQHQAALGYCDYGTAKEYVASTAEKLAVIALGESADTLRPIRPIVKAGLEEATAAARAGRTIIGMPTGFDRVDRLMCGLHRGNLDIIAARPGMGKTSFVVNVAVNVAGGSTEHDRPGQGVVIFSLEMPAEQLSNRMTCSEGRVDMSHLRSGTLTPREWDSLTKSSAYISQLPMWIDDKPGITLMDVKARVRRVQGELARRPLRNHDGSEMMNAKGERLFTELGLVVIDYLQLMQGTGDEGSRELEISGLARGLKNLAKECRVPVIALSQLNRAVETRSEKSKRPQLSDLRESGAIEQEADSVTFIYRDDYYNKQSELPGIAELIIAKQRSGPTGTVMVRFDRELTRFDSLAEGEHVDGGDRYQ